jgi:hypothetical protein
VVEGWIVIPVSDEVSTMDHSTVVGTETVGVAGEEKKGPVVIRAKRVLQVAASVASMGLTKGEQTALVSILHREIAAELKGKTAVVVQATCVGLCEKPVSRLAVLETDVPEMMAEAVVKLVEHASPVMWAQMAEAMGLMEHESETGAE